MSFPRRASPQLSTRLLLALLAASASVSASPARYLPLRHCPVTSPSQELRDTHSFLHAHEPFNNSLWNASNVFHRTHYSGATRRQAPYPLYTIDTYIHIIADNTSSSPSSLNYVTDTMISDQFTYLASAYTNASITFRLVGIDRTTNNSWASNGDDLAMKTLLRRGTYSSLNIYYQSALQSAPGTPGVPAGSTLLGYCSLPSAGITSTTSESQYVLDGCNVLSGTMPGGSTYGYNIGGTTAHEVGHWNGLLHTFQDNTCVATDFGDYVADTPQEEATTSGCPVGKDTCPKSGVPEGYTGAMSLGTDPYGPQGYSGVDPIHNFMDYSTDACYEGFTPGQGARMLNIWEIYRMGL